MKIFDEQTAGMALSRMLELVDSPEDFRVWCKKVGISHDFMLELAAMMEEERPDFDGMSFVNGIVLAWEVSRLPE